MKEENLFASVPDTLFAVVCASHLASFIMIHDDCSSTAAWLGRIMMYDDSS
jgi:hypothetical protein